MPLLPKGNIIKYEKENDMKVFVSGSKKIEYLNEEMKRILDKLISKKHDILIGDCIGVDLEVQEYLKEKKHRKTFVYYVGDFPRNNAGRFRVVAVDGNGANNGYEYYQKKDIKMTEDADMGFVIWDEESKGSYANIERMVALNKTVVVYLYKKNKMYRLIDSTHLKELKDVV